MKSIFSILVFSLVMIIVPTIEAQEVADDLSVICYPVIRVAGRGIKFQGGSCQKAADVVNELSSRNFYIRAKCERVRGTECRHLEDFPGAIDNRAVYTEITPI